MDKNYKIFQTTRFNHTMIFFKFVIQVFQVYDWNASFEKYNFYPNNFQSSYQTLLAIWWSYSQTILHVFLDIRQYRHFQRVTGKQYYTLFQSYIKQYWHFQSFPSWLNDSKNFFRIHITQQWRFQRITTKQYWLIQSSHQTVFTLSLS